MKILKATECFKMIESNKAIHCVDVREPYEYEFGNCGFQNIPMETLRHQAEQMDKSIEIMLVCRSGKRAEAKRNVRILHQLHQPADHPINAFHPEGEYLKGLILYVE